MTSEDSTNEPVPGKDLDSQLLTVIQAYRITQRIAHWFLAFVAVVAVISLVVSVISSVTQVGTTRRTVTNVVGAQCDFYRDLGTVPPPPKATQLGVKILVDSRNAYIGLGCAGKLPAPAPDLVTDAAQYGLELKG